MLISYNILNLPKTVTINPGVNLDEISYTYTANATKLQARKTDFNGGTPTISLTDFTNL